MMIPLLNHHLGWERPSSPPFMAHTQIHVLQQQATSKAPKTRQKTKKNTSIEIHLLTFQFLHHFFWILNPPPPPKKNITPYPSYPDIFNFHGKYLEPSCTSVGSGAAFWSFTWLNRGEEIPTTKVPPAEVVVGMTPSCSCCDLHKRSKK